MLIKLNTYTTGPYNNLSKTLLKYMNVLYNDKSYSSLLNFTTPSHWINSAAEDICLCSFGGTNAPTAWKSKLLVPEQLVSFSKHNINTFSYAMNIFDPPVDLERFTIGITTESKLRFLFTGDTNEYEGLTNLLEAWKNGRFFEEFELLLHIVDGSRHIKIDKLPKGVLQTDKILNENEICDLYKNSDFYVQLAHSEGWEQRTLEALACGCKVVATDKPSLSVLKKKSGVFAIPAVTILSNRDWCEKNVGGFMEFEWYSSTPKAIEDTLRKAVKAVVSRDKCRQSASHFDAKRIAAEFERILV